MLNEKKPTHDVPPEMARFINRHFITVQEYNGFHIGFRCGEEYTIEQAYTKRIKNHAEAWQVRMYFDDEGDDGWSSWVTIQNSELKFYERRMLENPNRYEIRALGVLE